MTTTAAPEILVCAAVAHWLASLPPETEVGDPESNCDCPLARYLRAHGYPTAHVYGRDWTEWHEGREDVYHETPAWVPAFIDALPAVRTITAGEALAVLRSLELPQEVEA